MGVPPEGVVAGAPGTQPVSIEPAVQQSSSPTHPPPLKPASPRNGPSTSVREEKAGGPIVDGPPTQFFDHPTSGPTPIAISELSPPMQTPNGFIAAYDDFSRLNKDGSDISSPRFMLDWNQMHMPMPYDGVVAPQLLVNSDMSFDPSMLPLASLPPQSADGMLTILPDLANGVAPLVTPIETPKVEQAFSHMELKNGRRNGFHQRKHASRESRNSISSVSDVHGEMSQVVAARDSWTVFRCTTTVPSSSCPTTAKLNLERLEQTLRNHEGWSTWSPQWDEADFAGPDVLIVMQLHESTRDKLLAITQSFLHKALEIHREGAGHQINGHHSPVSGGSSNFVLLPPGRVLEYFLRSYANCSERYYPLTSRGVLDSNELMHCHNDRAASLLVLMMIAQGAMNIPSVDARMLTGGLTEACRISLFDLIEKNIIMCGDPIVLHAALLFEVQAAWSGDKWQMDIAMGQRGMYLAMMRHSGVLENRPTSTSSVEPRGNTDRLWSEWIENEGRSRLVYSWVMVDQELSLFHDTAPLFAVTELVVPMPDADRLWQARNAAEWSIVFEQVHEFSGGYPSVGSGARPSSLRDLFRHFLDDEMIPLGIEMTPLQLRLLLHPLQGLVYQYSQLLSCFSDSLSNRNAGSGTITAASTRARVEEVQTLLRRWFDLAERYLKANPMCAMMSTNLIIFHLISLNAVTNFPEIERLARRESCDGTWQQLLWLHKRCISDIEEAVYHCGQVFRLVRQMPRGIRPPWWAGAIYRVALVLWTDSLARKDTPSPGNNGMFPVPGPSFAIDAVPPDHPLLLRYMTKREGVPTLTKRDGSQIGIDHAYPVLQHCMEVVEEGASTRFSDGIYGKLEKLART